MKVGHVAQLWGNHVNTLQKLQEQTDWTGSVQQRDERFILPSFVGCWSNYARNSNLTWPRVTSECQVSCHGLNWWNKPFLNLMWSGPDGVVLSLFSSLHWGVVSFCFHWTAHHFKPVQVEKAASRTAGPVRSCSRNLLRRKSRIRPDSTWTTWTESELDHNLNIYNQRQQIFLLSVIMFSLYWSQCCMEATVCAPQRHLLVVFVEMTLFTAFYEVQ